MKIFDFQRLSNQYRTVPDSPGSKERIAVIQVAQQSRRSPSLSVLSHPLVSEGRRQSWSAVKHGAIKRMDAAHPTRSGAAGRRQDYPNRHYLSPEPSAQVPSISLMIGSAHTLALFASGAVPKETTARSTFDEALLCRPWR